jgi:hypothetical protein
MVDSSLVDELVRQLQEMAQTVEHVQKTQNEIALLLTARSAGAYYLFAHRIQ